MESSSEYCCDDTPKIIKKIIIIIKADMRMCYSVGEC